MLVVKAQPTGWAKDPLLLHVVEESGASTVFVTADEAKGIFLKCETHLIYDIEVPGRCGVHTRIGLQEHGVETNYEVALIFLQDLII